MFKSHIQNQVSDPNLIIIRIKIEFQTFFFFFFCIQEVRELENQRPVCIPNQWNFKTMIEFINSAEVYEK